MGNLRRPSGPGERTLNASCRHRVNRPYWLPTTPACVTAARFRVDREIMLSHLVARTAKLPSKVRIRFNFKLGRLTTKCTAVLQISAGQRATPKVRGSTDSICFRRTLMPGDANRNSFSWRALRLRRARPIRATRVARPAAHLSIIRRHACRTWTSIEYKCASPIVKTFSTAIRTEMVDTIRIRAFSTRPIVRPTASGPSDPTWMWE